MKLRFNQEFAIIVRVDTKPCSHKCFDVCPLRFLSSRSNTCSFISFNDFHIFLNLCDIDLALSCMDMLPINAYISIN